MGVVEGRRRLCLLEEPLFCGLVPRQGSSGMGPGLIHVPKRVSRCRDASEPAEITRTLCARVESTRPRVRSQACVRALYQLPELLRRSGGWYGSIGGFACPCCPVTGWSATRPNWCTAVREPRRLECSENDRASLLIRVIQVCRCGPASRLEVACNPGLPALGRPAVNGLGADQPILGILLAFLALYAVIV